MSDEYEGGAEVVAVRHTAGRAVDLRDRNTDSWTDVVADASQLGSMIANTEFVPKGLRGDAAKVTAAILYSRELGLPPMTGLGGTHVIEGKAGISAELMRALVLQAGHELAIKRSDRTVCEIWGRRKGTEEWTKATWTIQEAQQTRVFISKEKGWQPLASKANWVAWPAEMLLARCTTRLVRMIFPDVAHGMRSVEELEDMSEAVDAEVVESVPVVAEPVQRRRVPRPAARSERPAMARETAEPVEVADVVEVEEAATVAPVERQRVARPAPRPASKPVENRATATAAAVPALAEVDTLPDEPEDGEVVDAEVVDDAPAAAAAPARKAIALVQMHWTRLGVTDRAERIWYTSVLVKREISSTNDLSLDELRELVNRLERAKDIDAVNAMIPRGSGE